MLSFEGGKMSNALIFGNLFDGFPADVRYHRWDGLIFYDLLEHVEASSIDNIFQYGCCK